MPFLSLGVTLRQGLLALAAGLLGAAAFWPLSLWPLMFVSIALFLRLLRDQDTQTARNIGLVYGLAFATGTMHWMFFIFGVLAVPLVAVVTAYFGLLGNLVALTRRGNHPTFKLWKTCLNTRFRPPARPTPWSWAGCTSARGARRTPASCHRRR